MNLLEEISSFKTIFIDTAPIIYYIEDNPQFGKLSKIVADYIQKEKVITFSSVLTLTEVLPKPVSLGKKSIVKKFLEFLNNQNNLYLLEISNAIAENAGYLRSKYPQLKTLDALQLAAAIYADVDAFLTNDIKLKQIKEIPILV